MVGEGDRDQRRDGPQEGRLQVEEPEAHRRVGKALGRAQPAAQDEPVPLGDVDAELLHEPRRQEPLRLAAARAGIREGPAPPAVPASGDALATRAPRREPSVGLGLYRGIAPLAPWAPARKAGEP